MNMGRYVHFRDKKNQHEETGNGTANSHRMNLYKTEAKLKQEYLNPATKVAKFNSIPNYIWSDLDLFLYVCFPL